jgi:hypothetical protein
LPLERLFGAVRDEVMQATGQRQEPYLYGSFGREPVYLVPPRQNAEAPAAQTAPPPPAQAMTAPAIDREAQFWQSIQASTNPADFAEYVRQFPNGVFAGIARNRVAALEEARAAGSRQRLQQRAEAIRGGVSQRAPASPDASPASGAQPQLVAKSGHASDDCYRIARSGGYVRLCLNRNSGRREETISVPVVIAGQINGNLNTRRETCSAPLTIGDLEDQLLLSWTASTCGYGSSSGGSTLCRADPDGGSIVCGSDIYRRE